MISYGMKLKSRASSRILMTSIMRSLARLSIYMPIFFPLRYPKHNPSSSLFPKDGKPQQESNVPHSSHRHPESSSHLLLNFFLLLIAAPSISVPDHQCHWLWPATTAPPFCSPATGGSQPMCCLQDPPPQVCRQLHFSTLLPTNRTPQVHHRTSSFWCQQHYQVLTGLHWTLSRS